MKRRIMAVLTVLTLLVGVFPAAVYAQDTQAVEGTIAENGTLTVQLETTENAKGEDVLQFTLSAGGELMEFMYTLAFDGQKLSLDADSYDFEWTADFEDAVSTNKGQINAGVPVEKTNQIRAGGVFPNAVSYTGEIAVITVKAADVAESGTVSYYNGSACVGTLSYDFGVMLGDVDENGEVAAADALCVLKQVVHLTELTQTQQKAADVDGDGEITAADALYILKHVVSLIDKFPAETK